MNPDSCSRAAAGGIAAPVADCKPVDRPLARARPQRDRGGGQHLGREPVELTNEARERIRRSRKVVDEILRRGEIIYGISTGFGKLSDVKIAPDALRETSRARLRQLDTDLMTSGPVPRLLPLSVHFIRAFAS